MKPKKFLDLFNNLRGTAVDLIMRFHVLIRSVITLFLSSLRTLLVSLTVSISHAVRWFPAAYAVVCVLVFIIAVNSYLSGGPKRKDFYGQTSYRKTCGPDPENWLKGPMTLAITLNKVEKTEATIVPTLYTKNVIGKKEGTLEPSYEVMVASMANGSKIFPTLRNIKMRRDGLIGDEVWNGEVTTIPIQGTPKAFPFDEYLIAIDSGNVEEVNSEERTRPILSVTVDLPKEYHVTELNDRKEFEKHNAGSFEWLKAGYRDNECLFLIQRSTWLKLGVLELVLLLGAPIIYVLYGEKESPGLELITTMVYIGYIRTYLLHPGKDLEFYVIDIVFAIVIIAVAVIPTIQLSLRRDGKKSGRLLKKVNLNSEPH